LSEKTTDISDIPEKHSNQENVEQRTKLGMFSSCTLEKADYKEKLASKEEIRDTMTNMKKSIEMQVAQEG
jgi:hypothetical protein